MCICSSMPPPYDIHMINFSLFIVFYSIEVGRLVTRPPPRRSLHEVFSAQGSSALLALYWVFLLPLLLFPSVRFACIIQPFVSGISFLCGLRNTVIPLASSLLRGPHVIGVTVSEYYEVI